MKKYNLKFFYPNLAKHNVSETEAFQALSDKKRLLNRIGSKYEPKYLVIGKTETGRILEIIYRIDKPDIKFVFHAMDARNHQVKRYKDKK